MNETLWSTQHRLHRLYQAIAAGKLPEDSEWLLDAIRGILDDEVQAFVGQQLDEMAQAHESRQRRLRGPAAKRQMAALRRLAIREEVRRTRQEKPQMPTSKVWLRVATDLDLSISTVRRAIKDSPK